MNNYEKNYENIRTWLNAQAHPQEIDFLGRRWRVDQSGVTQLSGPPAHINCKSVLVWYYTYGGEGDPSYVFKPLQGFSSGIFQSSVWSIDFPLTLEGFQETSARIGAELFRKERYGESRLMLALPKIPTLLTYAEADEEFPASLDVKFGSNATTFLPFETLAVLNALIVAEFRPGRVG